MWIAGAPKGGATRTVFFTPEQAEALIRQITTQPNPSLPALVTFWLGQGPRAGDTFALDGQDVNLPAGYAILRDTKNGEERRIDLMPRVVAALSRLPTVGKPGPLFRRFDGTAYEKRTGSGGQVRNPFAFAVEKIGLDLKVYTPHICRHTWATWHYAVNKDPLRLKMEGGWKSNEYQRYVKLTPPGLAESVLKHGWNVGGVGIDEDIRHRDVG
ncbi:tyrosine-type recombinase/integrase [Hoeflea sp.]|uniref:tyrosine-type recombinase/integrase n=1 Tax=Hoeflea sp. TaxID=1940281 RepID=UPI003B01F655